MNNIYSPSLYFKKYSKVNSFPTSMRLFCFHYAGGSASNFKKWANKLPEQVEVIAVQLPGRENRIMEKPFNNIQSIICELAVEILPLLDKPYVFFGHSMGALLSYEMSWYLKENFSTSPEKLIISSFRAPHLSPITNNIHDLSVPIFIEKLREMGGTSEEILSNQELMELIIPTIRADFEVCEKYVYKERNKLNCPIVAYGGTEDSRVRLEHLKQWEKHTSKAFKIQMLPGNHFYLKDVEKELLYLISKELLENN
ncbi:thioesterase II family protein [Bacillus cereus]|uniref:thioesterase II family protein n=1 Tax=Bacillus cereus TaxID=1396 RepID=UPI000BF95D8F|nr:thioesterase domain-containing protein [Bacillus cereus]PEW16212.1 thioesterase [Bacillus cereus]